MALFFRALCRSLDRAAAVSVGLAVMPDHRDAARWAHGAQAMAAMRDGHGDGAARTVRGGQ